MKLAIFLVLSCFIASTFTTGTSEALKKIAQGKFGKTLLDAIQLEITADSKADPRPRILNLLQEIKDEALEALRNLNDQHSQAQDQCAQTQGGLQDAIKALNDQITADNSEIVAKQTELAAVTTERDAKQAVVDILAPYLDQITNQRNQDQAAFEQEDNRQAQIIAVLERTRQFITDRLDARQSESGAFLEKENVLVQVKETVMSTEFQKLSPGWGQLINFLATKALNRIKQDDDQVAVAGLQGIVDLINQILADTGAQRSSAQEANNAQQAGFEEESADVTNQLTLARTDISTNDAHIAMVNDRIDELKNAVASNSQLASDRGDELADSQSSCDQENSSYAETSAARNAELQLIDEVIAIVNNDLTGLRQYTEDTITNSDIDVGDD